MREKIEDDIHAWGSWVPPVDIRVGPKKMRVLVEVPGVESSSLNLRMEGNKLILEGRKMPPAVKKIIHTEREYGEFLMVINLKDDVIPGTARAFLKAGVLEVEVSRANKKIKIQVEEENE